MDARTAVIRVLIADDAADVRQALEELFDRQPCIEVVGAAADAPGAVALARKYQPDVVLLDVRMPGDGHRAAREIAECSPASRIVALSAHDDRTSVVGMIRAGASSFVTKGTPARKLVEAVERAARGDSMLSEQVAREVVSALNEQLASRERELVDRERKLARVSEALRPDALTTVYQGVYALEDGRRVGLEALARFTLEPQRTPDLWFAEAWEVGLGVDLELAAVRAALEALEALPGEEFLGLNVSPETVCSPRFAEVLPAGSHPRLVLEITEHAPVVDYERLADHLDDHRRAGLRLAVDDAGAGYASLQHILSLRPDFIKLDMSLTRNVHLDPRRRALVAALVPFAAEIEATVIAEGIETDTELKALRDFGVDCGQGYLLAKPAKLDDALAASSPSCWF